MLLASVAGDIAAGIAAAATAGLLIAAWIAGRTAKQQLVRLTDLIEDQRTVAGRRRVYEQLAVLFDSNFVEMQNEALRLFGKGRASDDATWKQRWKSKSHRKQSRILAVLNFYEIFAGEYNDSRLQLIDKATADKSLALIASQVWVQAEPFVRWFRTYARRPRGFDELERLHDTLTGAQAADATPATAPVAPETGRSSSDTAPSVPAPPPAAARQSPEHAAAQDDCPPNPCEVVPVSVLIVAGLWTAAIVATFFCYIEIDAVADFFPTKIGSLPISAIWFGAVGGLLVSLEGIFNYNRRWLRSYDYWHYVRPLLGALMGTLGCLVFIVLADAASAKQAGVTDAAFFAVLALALGYRESTFRALLLRLIDTVIAPGEAKEDGSKGAPTQQ